jgi:hypothetical protein
VNFKKTILLLLSSLFLGGCIEPMGLMGPAITAGANGNIYQASLSYGTNQIIKKTTGKTTIEHISEFLDPNNEQQGDFVSIAKKYKEEIKLKIEKQQKDFFAMAQKKAEETKLKIEKYQGDFVSTMNNN